MMNNNFTNLSSIPCFYFCPEDGETVNEPNCFFIPADRHKIVTLKDVKKNFPFEGNYVFRLGMPHNTTGEWLWLDRTEDDDLLIDGQRIMLKVTRLNWRYKRDQDESENNSPVEIGPNEPVPVAAASQNMSGPNPSENRSSLISGLVKEENPNLLF